MLSKRIVIAVIAASVAFGLAIAGAGTAAVAALGPVVSASGGGVVWT
jgi:hypothetical protein